MTGNVSIDFSLSNIWKSWYDFKRGKRKTLELEHFSYYLEDNLYKLYCDLNSGEYKHGCYRRFIVNENKKREIAVASMRDRVVHRLVYNYLVKIYDKTLIYDAWSCRKDKGVIGAIVRAQKFALKYQSGYFYRGDIKKFFDNVDQKILLGILGRKLKDKKALWLIEAIIRSYWIPAREKGCATQGIPIGNLTSQIFANIYLNELDIFIKKKLQIKHYLRYGDDFLIFDVDKDVLEQKKIQIDRFILGNLNMSINYRNNYLGRVKQGIMFCGVNIFPKGRRLNVRIKKRMFDRLNFTNVASYKALLVWHDKKKLINLDWELRQISSYDDICRNFMRIATVATATSQ